ncbi:MAG: hypothetical protein ACI956_002423, partial [Nonlabens sp.]
HYHPSEIYLELKIINHYLVKIQKPDQSKIDPAILFSQL